jgi:hypothetical protein
MRKICLAMILGFTWTLTAAASDECERSIVFIPQIHGNKDSRHAQKSSSEKATIRDVLESQLTIYQFLAKQDARIPIFFESLGAEVSGEAQRSRLQEDLQINRPLKADKVTDLSEKDRAALLNYGAPIVLFSTGEKERIFGVSPSLEEHKQQHQKLDQVREAISQLPPGTQIPQELIDQVYVTRDQWALINVLKWFQSNPRFPMAFLVYGASHNFVSYQKLLPKGVCVVSISAFDTSQRIQYPIGDAALLKNYVQNEWVEIQ